MTMSIYRYLFTMGIATVVSAGSWFLVLSFLDPLTSGAVGIALFFGSFCLTVFGLCSLAGFFVRRLIQRQETPFRLVAVSFRQAGLFAILITGSLMLQSQRLFTLWTAFLLLLTLTLIEAYFVARQASRRQHGGSYGT